MKKFLCACLCAVMALLPCVLPAAAETLPTIDSLLKNGCPDGRIEVSDSLDAYSLYNDMLEDIEGDSIRLLILERHSPAKVFTEKTYTPPFSDDEGFGDNFAGVDVGKARVWLRGDLMNLLPDSLRASSLADATHIFLAEDIYYHASTLILTDYEQRDTLDPPEFETTEEMLAYFEEHQPVVASRKYYPVFGSFAFLSLYEAGGQRRVSIMDSRETEGKLFASNPEASQKWADMQDVMTLLAALSGVNSTDDAAMKIMISNLSFLPSVQASLWTACVDAQEYAMAAGAAAEYYWGMAEELKDLDPDEKNRKNYDLIIREKDYSALSQYVRYCDYGGFTDSMDSIRDSGEYLAAPDWDWLEGLLRDTVSELSK